MFRSRTVRLRDGRSARIRRAQGRDAAGIIAHVNAVGAEGVYLRTERLDRTPEEERARLREADGRSALFLVAVMDKQIVGTADIARGRHTKDRHTASLGIALRTEARGVGLGAAMMRAMLEWAGTIGVRKVTLGVFATNTRAVHLYRNLGFVPEGRLRGQVILRGQPVDELLMALWIRRFPGSVRRGAGPRRKRAAGPGIGPG